MTPEEREKMWKAEIDAENAKEDSQGGTYFLFQVVLGGFVAFFFVALLFIYIYS